MIPVNQTVYGAPNGNCFTACVASILERSLDDVPFFMGPGDWWERFGAWCFEQRLTPRWQTDPCVAPTGYSIMSGPSPRNPEILHAVVALDGVMVHDPHHADARGVLSVTDYITLESWS